MKRIFLSSLLVLATTTLTIHNTAVAHEPRVIAEGAINVAVGWRSEPAFSDTVNAFDLIITDDIEVDDVTLDVTALYLKEDAQDAKIKSHAKLEAELSRDRSNPNRFNIWFRPTKAGAYGFHLKGTINNMMVDEVFICRGGTQHAGGRSFGCIESAQTFPAGKKRRHHDND